MKSSPHARTTCIDCGNAPTSHLEHKINVAVGVALFHLNRVLPLGVDNIEPIIDRFVDRYFPKLFLWLARHHVGEIIHAPDSTVNPRERVFWEEGVRLGITLFGYRPFKKARIFSVAEYKGQTIVFGFIPRPNGTKNPANSWLDDKGMCHKVFEAHGIPMAKGKVVRTQAEASHFFRTLTPPVVVKPSRGSRSRHTTTHIETENELIVAFQKAKQLAPWVMIEEELDGFVYRGTVIGGKVIGVLRREPALIVGDGVHSIARLIMKENQDPKRNGPVFHPIELYSEEHDKELARQGMNLKSIPQRGEVVTLSQKASRGLGGGTTDVTDETHPDIVHTLERVANILGDPLVGVDFIVHDIKKPWSAQPRAGVIECNGLPFIDLHLFPLHGKPRNTPKALWELIFPQLTQT